MSNRILFTYGIAFLLILGLIFTYLTLGFWNALLALVTMGLTVILIVA